MDLVVVITQVGVHTGHLRLRGAELETLINLAIAGVVVENCKWFCRVAVVDIARGVALRSCHWRVTGDRLKGDVLD